MKLFPRKTATLSVAALLGATTLFLAGCTSSAPEPERSGSATQTSTGLLAEYGFDGLDAHELITQLESIPVADRPTDLRTSITPENVSLARADGTEESLPLPEDEFYLSFAPYIDQTHECFFHSPTGCIGELGNEEFTVAIVNTETGETLIDRAYTSADNGFIGVWLPRDVKGTLTVTHQEHTLSVPIATGDEDPTCLTTLQFP